MTSGIQAKDAATRAVPFVRAARDVVLDEKTVGKTIEVRTAQNLLSRASRDGRVPMSCDGIRTADRLLPLSGLAVGEGQHVGLRVLDSGVPAGTSFVVYLNASATVR